MSGYEKRKRCRWCGGWFTARRETAKYCAACKADIRRAEGHAQYRLRTGELAKEDYRAAVDGEVLAAVEERRRLEAANRPRCRFCGNVYSVNASGYCKPCRLAGFGDLHRETGRTNGWDRPAKPPRVAVEGGWRGRPVAGPGSDRRGTVEVAR